LRTTTSSRAWAFLRDDSFIARLGHLDDLVLERSGSGGNGPIDRTTLDRDVLVPERHLLLDGPDRQSYPLAVDGR
jgi:hypothetical protein